MMRKSHFIILMIYVLGSCLVHIFSSVPYMQRMNFFFLMFLVHVLVGYLAVVCVIPWAKANLNYTAQAHIVSASF